MKAVVFDFGYTLVNEDRVWKATAAQLGSPESVFFATLGAVIERRGRHRDVFGILGAAKQPEAVPFEPGDFYGDALPCLRAVKRSGRVAGIAGNFSTQIEDFLMEHAEVDFIASSQRWGVEKPSAEFFARITSESGCSSDEVIYVGDRIDNDVVPATAAGMAALHILRGPWAAVQQDWPEAQGVATISDLRALPA